MAFSPPHWPSTRRHPRVTALTDDELRTHLEALGFAPTCFKSYPVRKLVEAWGWQKPNQFESIAAIFGALLLLSRGLGVASRPVSSRASVTAKAVSSLGAATRGTGGGEDNFEGRPLWSPVKDAEGEMPLQLRLDPLVCGASAREEAYDTVAHLMWLTMPAAKSMLGPAMWSEVLQCVVDGKDSDRPGHYPFTRLFAPAALLAFLCGCNPLVGRTQGVVADVGAVVYGMRALRRRLVRGSEMPALFGVAQADVGPRKQAECAVAWDLATAQVVNGSVAEGRLLCNMLYGVGPGMTVTGLGFNTICCRVADDGGEGEPVVAWVAPSPVRSALFMQPLARAATAGSMVGKPAAESYPVGALLQTSELDAERPEAGTPAWGTPPFERHPPFPFEADALLVGQSVFAPLGLVNDDLSPPEMPGGIPSPPRDLLRRTEAVRTRITAERDGSAGFTLAAKWFILASFLWWPSVAGGMYVGLNHAWLEGLQRYLNGLWKHWTRSKSPACQRAGNIGAATVRAASGPYRGLAVSLGEICRELPAYTAAIDAAVAATGDPPECRTESRFVALTGEGYGSMGAVDLLRPVTASTEMFRETRTVYPYRPLRDFTLVTAAALSIGVKADLNIMHACNMLEEEACEVLSHMKSCCDYIRHGEDGMLDWRRRRDFTVYQRPLLDPPPSRLPFFTGVVVPGDSGDAAPTDPEAWRLARSIRARLRDVQRLALQASLIGGEGPGGLGFVNAVAAAQANGVVGGDEGASGSEGDGDDAGKAEYSPGKLTMEDALEAVRLARAEKQARAAAAMNAGRGTHGEPACSEAGSAGDANAGVDDASADAMADYSPGKLTMEDALEAVRLAKAEMQARAAAATSAEVGAHGEPARSRAARGDFRTAAGPSGGDVVRRLEGTW